MKRAQNSFAHPEILNSFSKSLLFNEIICQLITNITFMDRAGTCKNSHVHFFLFFRIRFLHETEFYACENVLTCYKIMVFFDLRYSVNMFEMLWIKKWMIFRNANKTQKSWRWPFDCCLTSLFSVGLFNETQTRTHYLNGVLGFFYFNSLPLRAGYHFLILDILRTLRCINIFFVNETKNINVELVIFRFVFEAVQIFV